MRRTDRLGVYMLQEFLQSIRGSGATDDGIRDLICALKALPAWTPAGNSCCVRPQTSCMEAALADALLHPQDRAYSVPQLFDSLERAGLTFGRWVRQAPYSVHCGLMATIPLARRMKQLPAAGQYAAVELFRGTMVRHNVLRTETTDPTASHRSVLPVMRGLATFPSVVQTLFALSSGCPPEPQPS